MSASSQRSRPDSDAEYWSMTDIANWFGWAVKTVHNYRASERLPPEDAVFGGSPLWRPQTILAWAKQRPGQGHRTDLRP